MRKLLGKIFSAEPDFVLRFARNGLEALAEIAREKPDVVTMDIQMPDMDGLTCLDRIMVETPLPGGDGLLPHAGRGGIHV